MFYALDFNPLKTPFLGFRVILKNLTDFRTTLETSLETGIDPRMCITISDGGYLVPSVFVPLDQRSQLALVSSSQHAQRGRKIQGTRLKL